MDYRKIRRRSSIGRRNSMDYNRRSFSRSDRQREDSRNRHYRRSSPPRRVHRDYDENSERRDHAFRREHHRNRYSERETPKASRCLGVFGMSKYTKEETLQAVFSPYGRIEKLKIIYDSKTNYSRGFAFIYYDTIEAAIEARERCNKLDVNGKIIRVDFSITNREHSPTPGIYLGNHNRVDYERDRGGRDADMSRYNTSYRRDSYQQNEGRERTYSRHYPRSYSRHRPRIYSR